MSNLNKEADLHPFASSSLAPNPISRRLTAHLHDLIIISYERSTNRPSHQLSLTRLEYVKGEKNGEKFSMHFDAQLRDHALNESAQLTLTINAEVFSC